MAHSSSGPSASESVGIGLVPMTPTRNPTGSHSKSRSRSVPKSRRLSGRDFMTRLVDARLERLRKLFSVDCDNAVAFRALADEIKKDLPYESIGRNANSSYSPLRVWTTQDYAAPGFAYCFIDRLFSRRCEVVCQSMIKICDDYTLPELDGCSVVDVGGGAGFGVAGVSRFLAERKLRLCSGAVLDPVVEWEIAANVFRDAGLNVTFHKCQDVNFMISTYFELAVAQESQEGTLVIVISHVLYDYHRDSRWWYDLQSKLGSRPAIILLIERVGCGGGPSFLVPDALRPRIFAVSRHVDDGSSCIALLLPITLPMPSKSIARKERDKHHRQASKKMFADEA